MGTTTIFCASDEFCKEFEPRWEQPLLESSLKRRRRQGALCLSEVMTIMVGFHLSGYRTFKHDYLNDVLRYQRGYFPGLVSYHRCLLLGERPVWIGLMGSSYTWSLMITENC